MLRHIQALALLSTVALATACSSAPAPEAAPTPGQPAEEPADPRSDDPTTADGIFTVTQAQRGHELFQTVCSECHDTEDWTETGFRNRWENESVFQLWYYINDRMPYDNPWSLTRQQVTDVLTYILQLNDLPAGDTELATDDDSIDDYWIVWDDD
ncbi:MAG: cytochrome c [Longimicrobiales bacterium]|nr:cytochrome c [Longimicrobiales bacterium]